MEERTPTLPPTCGWIVTVKRHFLEHWKHLRLFTISGGKTAWNLTQTGENFPCNLGSQISTLLSLSLVSAAYLETSYLPYYSFPVWCLYCHNENGQAQREGWSEEMCEAMWHDAKDPDNTQVPSTSPNESTQEIVRNALDSKADELDVNSWSRCWRIPKTQWEIARQSCKENSTFISWPTYLMFWDREVLLHHRAGEVLLTILKLRSYMCINFDGIEKENWQCGGGEGICWIDWFLRKRLEAVSLYTCYN